VKLFLFFLLGIFLLQACVTAPKPVAVKVEKPVIKVVETPPPQVQAAEVTAPLAKGVIVVEDALIEYIKKTLPDLKKGMPRRDVEKMLKLDTAFRGIVFSDGTRGDFKYYYEFGDYELVLSFSYNDASEGALKSFNLKEV
jgi:hypothetical protein